MTREEAIAELRERGLPVELLEVLRKAPVRLDDDEDPDPYGRHKMINAKPDNLHKTIDAELEKVETRDLPLTGTGTANE